MNHAFLLGRQDRTQMQQTKNWQQIWELSGSNVSTTTLIQILQKNDLKFEMTVGAICLK